MGSASVAIAQMAAPADDGPYGAVLLPHLHELLLGGHARTPHGLPLPVRVPVRVPQLMPMPMPHAMHPFAVHQPQAAPPPPLGYVRTVPLVWAGSGAVPRPQLDSQQNEHLIQQQQEIIMRQQQQLSLLQWQNQQHQHMLALRLRQEEHERLKEQQKDSSSTARALLALAGGPDSQHASGPAPMRPHMPIPMPMPMAHAQPPFFYYPPGPPQHPFTFMPPPPPLPPQSIGPVAVPLTVPAGSRPTAQRPFKPAPAVEKPAAASKPRKSPASCASAEKPRRPVGRPRKHSLSTVPPPALPPAAPPAATDKMDAAPAIKTSPPVSPVAVRAASDSGNVAEVLESPADGTEQDVKPPAAEASKHVTFYVMSDRECENCHTRITPCWRRGGLNNETMLCNRCGLFWRDHRSLRPPSPESSKRIPKTRRSARALLGPSCCSHCSSATSPTWRRGPDQMRLCNACGIYWQHKSKLRPLHLTSKRSRARPATIISVNSSGVATIISRAPGTDEDLSAYLRLGCERAGSADDDGSDDDDRDYEDVPETHVHLSDGEHPDEPAAAATAVVTAAEPDIAPLNVHSPPSSASSQSAASPAHEPAPEPPSRSASC